MSSGESSRFVLSPRSLRRTLVGSKTIARSVRSVGTYTTRPPQRAGAKPQPRRHGLRRSVKACIEPRGTVHTGQDA